MWIFLQNLQRLDQIYVLDGCAIFYSSFYIEGPPNDGKYFKVKLPVVKQENVWYTLNEHLFTWPSTLPAIQFGVYENSDIYTGSLGTAPLTYNQISTGQQLTVNTSAGNFHCNFQHAILKFTGIKA